MKNIIPAFPLVLVAWALVGGCGPKPSDSTAEDPFGQLTAAELAQLLDFHAWKVPIPQSQQPFKSVRLVVVKPDGTVAPWIDCGNAAHPPLSYSCILVGFHFERGAISGSLEAQDPRGGGLTWPLSRADVFPDPVRSWSANGTLQWKKDRVTLVSARRSGDANDTILALELLR